jgi:hypothetical protein
MAIARQHGHKHVSTATNKHTTIEEMLEAISSVSSVPVLYNKGQLTVELVASQYSWLVISH